MSNHWIERQTVNDERERQIEEALERLVQRQGGIVEITRPGDKHRRFARCNSKGEVVEFDGDEPIYNYDAQMHPDFPKH